MTALLHAMAYSTRAKPDRKAGSRRNKEGKICRVFWGNTRQEGLGWRLQRKQHRECTRRWHGTWARAGGCGCWLRWPCSLAWLQPGLSGSWNDECRTHPAGMSKAASCSCLGQQALDINMTQSQSRPRGNTPTSKAQFQLQSMSFPCRLKHI